MNAKDGNARGDGGAQRWTLDAGDASQPTPLVIPHET
jgi:hypothetical protein